MEQSIRYIRESFHYGRALGREAIRQGYSVSFATAQAVMTSLVKAHGRPTSTTGWRSAPSPSCW